MELLEIEMDTIKKAYKIFYDNLDVKKFTALKKHHRETEEDLKLFENKYEKLPEDYRWLLKEYGGCHFVDSWIDTLEDLNIEYPDFIKNYDKCDEIFPTRDMLFPIGGLGDGSFVCIYQDTGEIMALPHDYYVGDISELEVIASDFKELILTLAMQKIELEEDINEVQ